MTRPVLWSRRALDDIKQQVDFIAWDNPIAADRIEAQLRKTGEALGLIPTGRPGRAAGTYEKSVTRLPYVIVYALLDGGAGESVVILRVIHTARDWSSWPSR